MESPVGSGEANMYLGFAKSLATNTPWDAYDVVRSGGKTVNGGSKIVKWLFQRKGQGSFGNYEIREGTPDGDEGVGGYGIVSEGRVVKSEDHDNLKKKQGVAAWCLRPIKPGMDTSSWITSVSYLIYIPSSDDESGEEGEDAEEPDSSVPEGARLLDGVIIAVAVRSFMPSLASRIVEVGCTHAVAMDGSTSTVAGLKGKLRIRCSWEKDLVPV